MVESEKLLDEKEKGQRHAPTRLNTRSGKGRYQKHMQDEQESEPIKRPKTGLQLADRPTPRLLNRTAGHVIHPHLQSIANELEISRGKYSQTAADSSSAKTQIYKVDFCNKLSYCNIYHLSFSR